MKRRAARRGFTLLEVLISIAILALGMATVFGSSILAARGTAHARMITQAALIAQCRMTEVEAYLKINQLPEMQQRLDDPPDTGAVGSLPCCAQPFTCTAMVDKIELPQPADISNAQGTAMLNNAANSARGTSFNALAPPGGGDAGVGGDGGLGAIGALASTMSLIGGMSADQNSPLGGALSAAGPAGNNPFSSGGAVSPQGMITQLLGGIYPTVKPMLEGAIRKVTITVSWNEGARPFSFDVVEYYTNPGQTMASGDMLNQMDRMMGGGTAGSGAPGATPAPMAPAGGPAMGTGLH